MNDRYNQDNDRAAFAIAYAACAFSGAIVGFAIGLAAG